MNTATQDKSMLKVSGLNAFYGRAQILYDVELEVGRGEVVALMGRNGAGKSTTMKALMGMLPSRRGAINFCGHDIAKLPPYRIARLGMGFVPEDRRVFGDLTVMENLDTGRQLSDFHVHGALNDDRTRHGVAGRVCGGVAAAAGRERRGEQRQHRRQHVEPRDHGQQLSLDGNAGW